MKWVCLALLALGLLALGFGLSDFNRQSGADKMGGAYLLMIGAVLLALDFIIFFVWVCIRAFS